MKYNVSSLGRRAAALALALLLSVPPVFASSAGEPKLTTRLELAQGLTYVNTISQHPSTGRTESYALELSPDSGIQAIMLQSSGTVYASATVAGEPSTPTISPPPPACPWACPSRTACISPGPRALAPSP